MVGSGEEKMQWLLLYLMSQFLLFHIFVGENSNFMTHAGLSLNLLATLW